MTVQFTFYTMKEKTPGHNEDIMVLRKTSSFGLDGFKPKETFCVYQWVEADGTICGYSESDSSEDTKDMTLQLTCDGYIMDHNVVWCPVDEFYSQADEMFKE